MRVNQLVVGVGLVSGAGFWCATAGAARSEWSLSSVGAGVVATECSSDISVGADRLQLVNQAVGFRFMGRNGPLRWGGYGDLFGRTRSGFGTEVSARSAALTAGTALWTDGGYAAFVEAGMGGGTVLVDVAGPDGPQRTLVTSAELSLGVDYLIGSSAEEGDFSPLLGMRLGYRRQLAHSREPNVRVDWSGVYLQVTVGVAFGR